MVYDVVLFSVFIWAFAIVSTPPDVRRTIQLIRVLVMTEQPSIFDGLEGVGAREPVRRERTLAYGACPHCSAEKVGLVRSPDGRHLVWRAHNLTTWARTSLPCQSTAQRLCDAPARHIVGYDTPHCLHAKGPL